MHRERTKEKIYSACEKEGSFVPLLEINKEQLQAIFKLSLVDLATAEDWAKKAAKESGQWNAIYKLYYDVLHGLCETLIHFDKIKARSHECLFAYLCEKHPELELDWNFFDRIRTKRNGIHYYGEPAKYTDWKEIELQVKLYISVLRKTIEKKLAER